MTKHSGFDLETVTLLRFRDIVPFRDWQDEGISDLGIEDGDIPYFRDVAIAARSADGRLIQNRSAAHGAIVLGHILLNAKKEVKILSGSLNNEMYGRVFLKNSARRFLMDGNDRRIHIKVGCPIDRVIRTSEFYGDLYNEFGDSILLEEARNYNSEVSLPHFSVSESGSCRVELFPGDPDSGFISNVYFGENAAGKAIWEMFDKY